jgi:dimethylglycine dehydrogenase
MWFAPPGTRAEEDWRFERTNAFEPVNAEVRNTRENVGLIEISNYGKYEISGPGAHAFLDRIMAGRIPAPGRMALNPMLNPEGKIVGEFTVANLGNENFFLIGSGLAEHHHMRWFEMHKPAGVSARAFGNDLVGLSLAGPKARDVLQAVTAEDVSNAALPFLAIRRMEVGMVPALVGRVSFTGDLGYEIWVKPDHLRHLFETLMDAGAPHGIGLFGARALNAMRLEKGYGSWSREYRPIYTPREAGMNWMLRMDKGDFIGRDALIAADNTPPKMALVSFALEGADADAFGDEAILHNGRAVGWVTSGGYAPTAATSVALGYVEAGLAGESSGFEIEIIGEKRAARRLDKPLFDPAGARLRA